jgi:hypothetical protein
MTRVALAICARAALMMLSGCANGDGYHRVGGAFALGDPEIYYDGFYGPFYDGYWGPGGIFLFSEGLGRPFRRDEARHFRHEAAEGFHHVEGFHHIQGVGAMKREDRSG